MINFNSFLVKQIFFYLLGAVMGALVLFSILFFDFQKKYEGTIYPGIILDNTDLAGKSSTEIGEMFAIKNRPLESLQITLFANEQTATLSASELKIRFDDSLSLTQAFSFGRTGSFSSDLFFKLCSFFYEKLKLPNPVVIVTPVITYNTDLVSENIYYLKQHVDVAPIDPLFEFAKETQKVKAFRLGKNGYELNEEEALKIIETDLKKLADGIDSQMVKISLPIKKVLPNVSSTESDNLGIKTLLGTGYSLYKGSITGRIHNLILASSILNGQLVLPGETFSFNKNVGDVSSATGYKPAYIIKGGRTILDDGGGVCQVSTTLFRAVLNAGLPIIERYPHSYRPSYYELGGFKPGLDATVFAPSVDFKFKNDMPAHLLIQTKVIPSEQKLVFELYGTSDERQAEIYNFKLWDQKPPPPPLYQDDPTLPVGTEKQVDWAAWGAKASFDYKVTRNEEVIFEKTFYSNFQPWQAVYLRGTKTN